MGSVSRPSVLADPSPRSAVALATVPWTTLPTEGSGELPDCRLGSILCWTDCLFVALLERTQDDSSLSSSSFLVNIRLLPGNFFATHFTARCEGFSDNTTPFQLSDLKCKFACGFAHVFVDRDLLKYRMWFKIFPSLVAFLPGTITNGFYKHWSDLPRNRFANSVGPWYFQGLEINVQVRREHFATILRDIQSYSRHQQVRF